MDKSKTKGLCRLIAKLTVAANRSIRKNDYNALKKDSSKARFKIPPALNTFEPRLLNRRIMD